MITIKGIHVNRVINFSLSSLHLFVKSVEEIQFPNNCVHTAKVENLNSFKNLFSEPYKYGFNLY